MLFIRKCFHRRRDNRKENCNDVSFYKGKEGRKLIAVELAPPLGIDDEKIMDAAF